MAIASAHKHKPIYCFLKSAQLNRNLLISLSPHFKIIITIFNSNNESNSPNWLLHPFQMGGEEGVCVERAYQAGPCVRVQGQVLLVDRQ
jgi:hypothetical protein